MKIASNKISDVVRYFRDELKDVYDSEELETIMAYCFEEFVNMKRAEITLNKNKTISESELLKFSFAVKDLKQQNPIQYVLSKADFYGMKFIVNKNVLIPRPETEELVHLIIKENKESQINILDIGTGSGCIAIALKKHIPSATVYAMDISEEALKIAKQNAVLNDAEINFIQDNILQPTSDIGHRTSDIIVSNPPYVCISEKETMNKNVLEYEPHLALFVNDSNPLLFYNAIVNFALRNLKKEGKLYFEINEAYGDEIKMLMEGKGFKNVALKKDINNKNRIVKGEI